MQHLARWVQTSPRHQLDPSWLTQTPITSATEEGENFKFAKCIFHGLQNYVTLDNDCGCPAIPTVLW